jgi:tetratricopeptide (TPR) repeat protein
VREGDRESVGEEAQMMGRRRNTLAVFAVALTLILCVQARSQEALTTAEIGAERAAELFLEGNALYADGEHEDAAERYARIVAGGFENADVYYNLANARFKSGEIAEAVLGYERALILDPSHADARSNLDFVRGQLADRQVPVGEEMPQFFGHLARRADTRTLTVTTSAFYFLLVGCAILGIARRVFPPWLVRTVVVLVVLTALSGAALGLRLYRSATERGAVVTASDVAVRTGPGGDFVLEFRLHEGTKVRVMESRDEWSRISVGGTELEGWLPSRAVEAIEWR